MSSRLYPAAAEVPFTHFDQTLQEYGLSDLQRCRVTTLQVNVGRLCNLACHHCHVEAGPRRTEIMDAAVTSGRHAAEARASGAGSAVDSLSASVPFWRLRRHDVPEDVPDLAGWITPGSIESARRALPPNAFFASTLFSVVLAQQPFDI